jgi:hypothetical protein
VKAGTGTHEPTSEKRLSDDDKLFRRGIQKTIDLEMRENKYPIVKVREAHHTARYLDERKRREEKRGKERRGDGKSPTRCVMRSAFPEFMRATTGT